MANIKVSSLNSSDSTLLNKHDYINWHRLSGNTQDIRDHWLTDHIGLGSFLGGYNETKYLLLYASVYDSNGWVDGSRYSFGVLGITRLSGSIRFNYHAIVHGSNIGLDFFNYGESPFINLYIYWLNYWVRGYITLQRLN